MLASLQCAQDLPAAQVITEEAVVQIAAFNGTQFLKAGSGTIIHPSGLILTNFHVISMVNASDAEIQSNEEISGNTITNNQGIG